MGFYGSMFTIVLVAAGAAKATPLTKIHSHNDYNQKHPLDDALAENLYSVEADVWLKDGEIRISNFGIFFKGSLENLYLKPLQKIIDKRHSVYGDSLPFYLWIDLKGSNKELVAVLNKVLNRYKMFTVFTDDKIIQRPVIAVLTGNDDMKKAFVHDFKTRKGIRDSNDIELNDPMGDNRWGWYALNWNIVHGSSEKLQSLVNLAHSKNRKIRFWNMPDEKRSWALALKSGVDQISTDKLHELHEYILSQP